MAQIQIRINADGVPINIALDSVTNSIAFSKQSNACLIDKQKELPDAIWMNKQLVFDGVTYKYNVWHNVVEGSFKEYFAHIIEHGMMSQGHTFTF